MKSSTLHSRTLIYLKSDSEPGAAGKDKELTPAEKEAAEKKDKAAADDVDKLSPEELKAKQRELKDITRGKKPKKEEKEEERKDEPEKKGPAPAAAAEKKEDLAPAPAPAKAAPAKAAPVRAADPVEVPPPIGTEESPASKKSDELTSTIELSAVEKRRLRVLQQMEREGTAPAGTAQKAVKFLEQEAAYIEQWEKANPGQDFNDEAEEHQAFYAREVTYDADAFEIARDNVVAAEVEDRVKSKQSKEQAQQKRAQEFHSAQESFAKDSTAAVIEMVVEAAPELAKLMGEGKDRTLTKEITEKMMKEDPAAVEILQETAEELSVLNVELQRLTQFDDVYQPDMKKPVRLQKSGRTIYPHASLLNFITGLEAEMLSMPPEQTMRGKARLVANEAFNREQHRIATDGSLDAKTKREALAQLNSRYYTLTEDDFRRGLVAQYAHTAKQEIEKFTKRLGSRTVKPETAKPEPGSGVSEEPKVEPVEEAEETRSAGARTRSPSTASESALVDMGKKNEGKAAESVKDAVARSRGR